MPKKFNLIQISILIYLFINNRSVNQQSQDRSHENTIQKYNSNRFLKQTNDQNHATENLNPNGNTKQFLLNSKGNNKSSVNHKQISAEFSETGPNGTIMA